jgi:hypothetical protein
MLILTILPLRRVILLIDWTQQAKACLHVAWYSAQTELDRKYAYNIVDRTLRAGSDIISSESCSVVNNTGSVIQWCVNWSHDALDTYWIVKEQLTHQRDGKPPTHRQITQARDENKKRWWTVEHQYPILIPKIGLLDEGWSESYLIDWMMEFGKATIVTQSENSRLTNHTKSMEEASNRYKDANIVVCRHPYFA